MDDLSSVYTHAFAARHQAIQLGTQAEVPRTPARQGASTWTALVWPSALYDRPGCVMAEGAFRLDVSATGVTARLGDAQVATGVAVQTRRWYRIWASHDPATGRFCVGQAPLENGRGHAGFAEATVRAPAVTGGAAMTIAAAAHADHFTGKIEDPAILAGFSSVLAEPARAAAWHSGMLGFLAPGRHAGDRGYRAVGVSRHVVQRAHPRHGRRAVVWRGDVLAPCAARLCGDPVPRGCAERLPLDAGFRVHRAGGSRQRPVRAAHRGLRRRGLDPALCRAAEGCATQPGAVPGADFHLSRLCQPCARQFRCGIPRPRCRVEGISEQS